MYGNRLKEMREEKGLSQEELARKLNISRQAISKWENDKTEPDLKSLKMLCDIYEITLDQLVLFHNEKSERENRKKRVNNQGIPSFENEWFGFLMLIITICSCMIAPLGIVVSIGFLVFCKKIQNKHWRIVITIVCIIALILSTYNCVQALQAIFSEGYGSVEYLG